MEIGRLRFFFGMSLLLLAVGLPAETGEKVWNFDRDASGKPPAGFTFALTGQGAPGIWVVMSDSAAPSPPNALAQTSVDKTGYRFPLALADGTSYKDFVLSVKFKAVSGSVDQAAGLVFRAKDTDNYYVARANALENNFRLYHVVRGRRVQFAGANLKVTPQVWHEIKVEARGDKFRCSFDGQLEITATDAAWQGPGQIGLWTKADSVTYFDDLTVRNLVQPSASITPGSTLAQELVEQLAAGHPELVRIALHVTPPNESQNVIIASNVPERIGRPSDAEDLQAMRLGQPIVLKEGEDFDVTLPLHDAVGRIIGAIGLTFKPGTGESEEAAIRRACEWAGVIEKQIPSKAGLFHAAD